MKFGCLDQVVFHVIFNFSEDKIWLFESSAHPSIHPESRISCDFYSFKDKIWLFRSSRRAAGHLCWRSSSCHAVRSGHKSNCEKRRLDYSQKEVKSMVNQRLKMTVIALMLTKQGWPFLIRSDLVINHTAKKGDQTTPKMRLNPWWIKGSKWQSLHWSWQSKDDPSDSVRSGHKLHCEKFDQTAPSK